MRKCEKLEEKAVEADIIIGELDIYKVELCVEVIVVKIAAELETFGLSKMTHSRNHKFRTQPQGYNPTPTVQTNLEKVEVGIEDIIGIITNPHNVNNYSF